MCCCHRVRNRKKTLAQSFSQAATRALEELLRDSGVLAVDGSANVVAGLLVLLHEAGKIEAGLLEDLDLTDGGIPAREDALNSLLDLLADGLGKKLSHELLKIALGSLVLNNLNHLSADLTSLAGLAVASLGHAVALLAGEGDGEETNSVAVAGADVNTALDEGNALLDEGAELVAGQAQAVEGGENVVTLDILGGKLDLNVTHVGVVLKVSKRHLEDAALDLLRGDLGTGGAGAWRLAGVTDSEDTRGLDSVPVQYNSQKTFIIHSSNFVSIFPLIPTHSFVSPLRVQVRRLSSTTYAI